MDAKLSGQFTNLARSCVSLIRSFLLASVQPAKPSSEVVVPKADSLVGPDVSLNRLDHLLHNTIAGNSSAVLSPPLIRFSLLSAATFLLLLAAPS